MVGNSRRGERMRGTRPRFPEILRDNGGATRVRRENSLKRMKPRGAGGGFAASNTAARVQPPSRDKSPEVAAQHCGRVPVKTGRGREAGRNSRRAGSARNRGRLSWRRKTPKGTQNLTSVLPTKNGNRRRAHESSGGRRKLADESEATPARGIRFATNPEDESLSRIKPSGSTQARRGKTLKRIKPQESRDDKARRGDRSNSEPREGISHRVSCQAYSEGR